MRYRKQGDVRPEGQEPTALVRGGAIVLARDLVKEYTGADPHGAPVMALRGVGLEVAAGDWVAVVGPSGCGKSTLLNVLAGIDSPTAGSVRLLDQQLLEVSEAERARLRLRRVGFVFQRFHLLSVLTARENVELPMAEAGVGRGERRRRSAELLEFVGLAHRLDHRSTRLSGGEQQRVAIARALANQPEVIFADEPTGELDQATGAQILDLFGRLNEDGATVLMVTHDPDAAARASRVIEMTDGRIVAERRGTR
jgi:putative ABC transport system ATP-binding protein